MFYNFKLTWLNVGNNKITGLPPTFGDLTEMIHLDLSCNEIELAHIPKSFFAPEMSLERLYLSDNIITELSDEFTRLTSLKILALRY